MGGEAVPVSKHGTYSGAGVCRSCKQNGLVWVTTFKNQRPMLVDPAGDEPHFAKCPDGPSWSRGKAGSR